jgi:methylmalonyl-CoA/ethylmalonyl-CoA epimerase
MSQNTLLERPVAALASPFLGRVEEVCIVTPDLERTATGLMRLGIGPWKILEINPRNTSEQTYRGRPAAFSIRVGFAQVADVIFELMQPLSGPSIFAEHLAAKGEGLHHISFSLDGAPWAERVAAFEARGFPVVQSGLWLGGVRFAFFDTEQATGASFETYRYPPDYVDPAGEVRWLPHPPLATPASTRAEP